MFNQELIVSQEVIVNQQLQEKIRYEHPDFPVARFIDQLDQFADGSFLCHWHTEFELAVVLKGNVEYQLGQETFQLTAGKGIFINSQILHSARQLSAGSVIFNIEFLPTLFNTVGTSLLYQKYFSSLSKKNSIGCLITEDTEYGTHILQRLRNIHSLKLTRYTYELSCMEDILSIWRSLLHLKNQLEYDPPSNDDISREHRLRKMVAYIQTNFDSPITVEDIAAAASISRSECFRCFSIFCHIPPMEYVNRYRLQYAAQKLLITNESISSVSSSSGFSSISCLGKAFRKVYGVSPSDFRKRKFPEDNNAAMYI